MVDVEVATFGAGISLNEIILLFEFLFIALVVVNVFTGNNFTQGNLFEILQDKVIGYPACLSPICVGPSQADFTQLSNGNTVTIFSNAIGGLFGGGLSGLWNNFLNGGNTGFQGVVPAAINGGGNPSGLIDIFVSILALFDVIKGIVGIYAVFLVLHKVWAFESWWAYFWGQTPAQLMK